MFSMSSLLFAAHHGLNTISSILLLQHKANSLACFRRGDPSSTPFLNRAYQVITPSKLSDSFENIQNVISLDKQVIQTFERISPWNRRQRQHLNAVSVERLSRMSNTSCLGTVQLQAAALCFQVLDDLGTGYSSSILPHIDGLIGLERMWKLNSG